MKMNAYKDFHIFACKSVIKTCLQTYKNAQHWISFSYSSEVALMSTW